MLEKGEMERLFRTYYGAMVRTARTLLEEEEEAKDAVSDVFTLLLEGRIRLPTDRQMAYLMATVRNSCLNRIRHRRVQERARLLYPLDCEPELKPAELSETRLESIQQIIRTDFTASMQTTFRLRFEKGMTLNDIAGRQGVSIPAICKQIATGLRKIKSKLDTQKDL